MEQEFLEFHQLVDNIYEQKYSPEDFFAKLHQAAERKIVLWPSDLMEVDESVRMRFFLDLKHLEVVSESVLWHGEIAKLDDERKTFFGLLHMMLCNYSDDLLMIYNEFPFNGAIHIACGECGNDVHSVLVNPAVFDDKNKTTVIPREYDAESDGLNIVNIAEEEKYQDWDEGDDEDNEVMPLSASDTPEGFGELNCDEWDIFTNIMRYLDECKEKYLSGILRYLYGEHKCSKCGGSETVIKSYKRWFRQNRQNFAEPSSELIDWIIGVADKASKYGENDLDSCYDYEYARFMYKMAAWYEKDREIPDERRLYEAIVSYYDKDIQKNNIFVKILQHVLRKIADTNYDKLKAKMYNIFSRSVSFEYHKKDDNRNRWDLSWSAYQKSLKIQQDAKLYDELCYWITLNGMCLIVAESGREEYIAQAGKVEELILDYIRMKEENNGEISDIGEAYNRLAYMFAEGVGDFEKCYGYFSKYIKISEKIYGKDSDYVADLYEELADYYEEDGQENKACGLREKALEINIREMGKMYLLPPVFKKIVLFAAKVTKAIDEEDKFTRVMSAASSYTELGESYCNLNMEKQALDCCEKAQALFEWEFKNGNIIYEMAKVHKIKGDVYRNMGDKANSEKEYKIAFDMCNTLIRENQSEYEVEDCEELIEEIKENVNL